MRFGRDILLIAAIAAGCAQPREQDSGPPEEVELSRPRHEISSGEQEVPDKLSAFGFFIGAMRNHEPAKGVVPYAVNAALFSDYAWKKRFFRLPDGAKMKYQPEDPMDFPEGSVVIKTFYYPADFRQPEQDLRLLETRLLIRKKDKWTAYTYVWNDEQTEAFHTVAGTSASVNWIHYDGQPRSVKYMVPNQNQCKNCHQRGDALSPIGPTARQLNRQDEGGHNQLEEFSRMGYLDLPPSPWPTLADYNDPHAPTADRARAWLEVNCAHCHRPDGPAKTSGLHLLASVKEPLKLGIGKSPVAAGKGSGGRTFDIVPGQPDKSILMFRISSTDPGVMMPELGRSSVHSEGIELVKKWIAGMEDN